jgi:2-haloalkanoic acid dehalogenase type II
MDMTVKAIFMDFYGTIVHEEEESLLTICHKIKSATPSNDVSVAEIGQFWMKEFNQLIETCHGEFFLSQRDLSASSLRNTLTAFQSEANLDELLELMFHHWKRPTIYPDATEFFEKNKTPVYLLSNVDLADITEAINLLNLEVAGVITSQHVKAYKPHQDVFNYALELSGYQADEVVHVGDSLSSDVSGANLAGIKSIWINRYDKPVGTEVKPHLITNSLNKLLDLSLLNS